MWIPFKGGSHDGDKINLSEPLGEFQKIPNVHSSLPIRMDGELYRVDRDSDGAPTLVYVGDYDDTPAITR